MTKWCLTLEGDFFEDKNILDDQINASNYKYQIIEALEKIRSRIKYHDNVSDIEEKFLDELRQILFIPDKDY